MQKYSVKNLYKEYSNIDNEQITIEGWVKTIRDSKTFGFIELNDGTFFKNIQIVISDKLNNFKEVSSFQFIQLLKLQELWLLQKMLSNLLKYKLQMLKY